jgi:peptidyl-prolyl cis-trans isomerase D
MISSFRNFAKSKFAGILVFLMIIPFVFWGMGGMFSSGNTNNIAKINNTNISIQEFIDYLNKSGIPQDTIRKNINNNIIEELLSGLVSKTLLDLEIEDFNLIISENTLLKRIKENKNFLDENGNFQRIKYEKFLLENNQTAPQFELRLKNRELQKSLFDYIGAGTISPKFFVKKMYEEENKKLDVEFIDLNSFYKKKKNISIQDMKNFLNDNEDQLKLEYVNFEYTIINPKKLLGIDEFNQSFFDKIDQIEIDISNNVQFKTIISNLNLDQIKVTNFKISTNTNEIEKKIFQLRNNRFDIFENGNDYIIYNISNIELKLPDLKDNQTINEITELVFQKYKFDYNRKLLEKIRNNKFNNSDFIKMGQEKIESIKLNSIKDNNKFEVNAVEILYSLPINSFTLVNDEKNNIYLAKIKKFHKKLMKKNNDELNDYLIKQNSKSKNTLLKSYDLFLKDKYNIILNQKAIERVRNSFQ